MKKIKFILSANNNGAEIYAKEKKLKPREWAYLHNVHRQLSGLEAKNVEFIFLDSWYLNDVYEDKIAKLIMQEFFIFGATKTYE